MKKISLRKITKKGKALFLADDQGLEHGPTDFNDKNVDPNSIICLQPTDISLKTKLNVFSQHVDYYEKSKNTGYVIPEAIKDAGAKGLLLNHSEHKVSIKIIGETIKRCRKLGLKIIVCISSLKQVKQIKNFNPYAIAFEDSKLIATGKSITKYNPEKIKKFVNLLEKIKIIPICGAGISSIEDYKKARVLGCKGVLISSAIVNSKNPIDLLKNGEKTY